MSFSGITGNEGITSTMPAKLRSLVQAQKPEVKITLVGRKKVYSTLDKIEGTVSITAPVDTPFYAVDIEFVGTSRTYIERMTTAAAVSGRSEAFHQFLKLSQPGLQQHYPEDDILKAGQTYDFPFVFVVPQQLLPRICQHKVQSPLVRDAHLTLPPTFGDREQAKSAGVPDDMAPEMASVRYGIFARVSKSKVHDDETVPVSLASRARRLRIIPAVDEQPPLMVGDADSEYTMRKEKTIRKGMLKGKLGTLVMEAAQPQSLRLRSTDNPECRTTTMATVMMRFDPADENSPPPKLGSLASKLKIQTFFSSTARQQFPTKAGSILDLSQGMHAEQINLSSRCMANVEWLKHSPSKSSAAIERRDSACSTNSLITSITPLPSETYKLRTYYTARLLVPITLPTTKTLVPTFHSCLISRIYQLKLQLDMGSMQPSMDLRIPIQISSESTAGDVLPRRDSADSDAEEVDAENVAEFFRARRVSAPPEHFVGRSRIGSQAPVASEGEEDEAPPGYSALPPSMAARTMSRPGRVWT